MDDSPEEPGGAGVRAPIGAKKSRNGDGAKGCRKVDSNSAERRWQHQCECPRGLSKLVRQVNPSLWAKRMLMLIEVQESSLCLSRTRVSPLGGEPLTGEPDAGDPLVRFGGRGSA